MLPPQPVALALDVDPRSIALALQDVVAVRETRLLEPFARIFERRIDGEYTDNASTRVGESVASVRVVSHGVGMLPRPSTHEPRPNRLSCPDHGVRAGEPTGGASSAALAEPSLHRSPAPRARSRRAPAAVLPCSTPGYGMHSRPRSGRRSRPSVRASDVTHSARRLLTRCFAVPTPSRQVAPHQRVPASLSRSTSATRLPSSRRPSISSPRVRPVRCDGPRPRSGR
jgi:hypothetical protein